MARTISNDEELKDVNPEGIVEQTEEQSEKETAKAGKPRQVTVTTQTKKVRVRATEEIDCMVANIPYKLAKDKEHLIPSDVAAVLVNSGKVYRI